jgi:CRISPR-associated protein Csd1
MILQRLNDLYYRLAQNPDPVTGLARVPPYGFTDENISYCLVLSKDGVLVDIQDVRDTSEKKPKARRLSVPRPEKRTSGVKSNFLWDKTAYVLGIEGNKDKVAAKEKPWVMAEKPHAAFRTLHLELLDGQDDVGLKALRRFVLDWTPEHFAHALFTADHVDANVVFKLDGEMGFIHESAVAQRLWLSLLKPESHNEEGANNVPGMCLVTGEHAALSRLHPAIKGVYGGQSSGGSIVSFNAEAYESFGKEQGDNAPVSEQAAFAYTTALNYLLRREHRQCLSVGDTSTVFWAQADDVGQEALAVDVFSAMLNPPSDDEGENKQLRLSLEKIAHGRPFQDIAPDVDLNTRFFVLGLAPNAARLSIRYWLDSSMGELGQCLSEHWADMQITPSPWSFERTPGVRQLLLEVVPLRKKDGRYDYRGRSFDDIPPQLAGEFLRSILTGQRYPRQLLTQIVQRMRADGDINGLRAALIKAVLHRDHRKGFTKEAIPMSLEIEGSPLAYRLGCLFAVLAKAQSDAIPGANATIVDRYSVFPRLISGFQNHLSKLRKDETTKGWAVNHEKLMSGILGTLPATFPKQLTIEQQGQFAVGYYHQKQAFFSKKGDAPETESTPSN